MADIQNLEKRFEAISVQEENQDPNAAYQHKTKVRVRMTISVRKH